MAKAKSGQSKVATKRSTAKKKPIKKSPASAPQADKKSKKKWDFGGIALVTITANQLFQSYALGKGY